MCRHSRSILRPPRTSVVRAFLGGNHKSSDHNGNELPLSMFLPYKQLPYDGEVIPAADKACDPGERRCKTPIYTYESKCHSCSGTGFMKSIANGRHASLYTCLSCTGLGYVRHTTARFTPPEPGQAGGSETFTMGRPEREKETPAAAAAARRLARAKAAAAKGAEPGAEKQ
ncbi:Protein disulfide-isomerase SCO2 [Tetrabaena socialis]|uniref:Protein disulfide-isomerase SCO2 n=1 Tax=Tetrabaena socialis TaxID=47790 RepID=A0A2J8A8K2_9CHLO|nr:Protein disulfide-isomerase SCO2 [Tetrabaena socialis]|eukprot:PNH08848.1 Protein disulfide-isomerase SCO2 [Tetrabaena socialis]